jgi:hypothetical protein
MKTRTLLHFVPRVLKTERFSLRGAAAFAVLAVAMLTGSCIPSEQPGSGNGSRPGVSAPIPPIATPPGSPPAPGAPPSVAPPPPGSPPVVAPPPGSPPPPSRPPANSTVTLIVGDEDELTDGDEELSDLLEDLGFDVDELDDGEDADEIDDSSLVIIAGSASAGQVGDEYANVRVPVLVMNDGILSDMNMTGDGNDESGQENAEEVEIALASHPIATGLNGTFEVVGDRAQLQWGAPPATAKVIARLADDPDFAAVFVYDEGDQMQSGQAPARRVFFFASDEASEDLTNEGEQLFENAVLWAWSGQVQNRPD